MPEFIDVHSHVLPGIDDGSRNESESFVMIDRAEREGVRFLFATPHVHPGVDPYDGEMCDNRIDILNSYCRGKGYRLRVLGGAEIMWTRETIRFLKQNKVPTMAGSCFTLVEWQPQSDYAEIEASIREMSNAGYIVICSHVERYHSLYGRGIIERFKEFYDVRIQVDCETVIAKTSIRTVWFLNRLFREKLVDYVATDAHNLVDRPINMRSAYDVIKRRYGKEYALALLGENQREILEQRM